MIGLNRNQVLTITSLLFQYIYILGGCTKVHQNASLTQNIYLRIKREKISISAQPVRNNKTKKVLLCNQAACLSVAGDNGNIHTYKVCKILDPASVHKLFLPVLPSVLCKLA